MYKTLIQFFKVLLFFLIIVSCENIQGTKSSYEVIERLVGERASEFELSLVNVKHGMECIMSFIGQDGICFFKHLKSW